MTVETEHLLHEKEASRDEWIERLSETEHDIPRSKESRFHTSLAYQMIIHLMLLVGVIYVATDHFWTPRTVNISSYTPVAQVARYYDSNVHALDHGHHSIYSGEPTKENVEAWDDLVDPTFFGLSREELIRSGASLNEAVRLADYEDQYLAGLGVYHDLHCLRQVRFWVYKDHYYSNLTQNQIERNTAHLAHCIEALRVTLMCSADLTLYTFQWDDPDEIRPNPKVHTTRQCLQWEPLDRWSRERSVGYYPWLIRPSGHSESVHMA